MKTNKIQKFKGLNLTYTSTVKNILSVYKRSETVFKNEWYVEANQYARLLAARYNKPVSICAGIIAALSPIKTWDENKWIAELFLKTGRAKHTSLFADKARAILESDGTENQISAILRGRKITSFFHNILHPDSSKHVTIDRHALSVALGFSITEDLYRGMTGKQYDYFVESYNKASEQAQISPVLLQSTTWQQWRKEKGIKDESIELTNIPF